MHRTAKPAGNGVYLDAFKYACATGHTATLTRLIAEKKFKVNQSMHPPSDNSPLALAIANRSVPVAALLLDHGANPNFPDGSPLLTAIKIKDLRLMRYLLERGADPHFPPGKILEAAVAADRLDLVTQILERGVPVTIESLRSAMENKEPGKSGVLKVLLKRMSLLARKGKIDGATRQVVKHSELCQAILGDDGALVSHILKIGDYDSYAEVLGTRNRPVRMAQVLAKSQILKVFVHQGTDVEDIYLEAVAAGNLELVEMCASRPGFNVNTLNWLKQGPLHLACEYKHLEVVKVLVGKYGLDLEAKDCKGETPVLHIKDVKFLRELLSIFPEIDLNVTSSDDENLLTQNSEDCKSYAAVLELGVDVTKLGKTKFWSGHFDQHNFVDDECEVNYYLQKMSWVDLEYTESIVDKLVDFSMDEIEALDNPAEDEYEAEIEKLERIRMNHSTPTEEGKSLLDFMCSSPNEAAKYSNNKVVLRIYEDTDQNFETCFPHFGFALNRQLRRGLVRCSLLESAVQLLGSALGVLELSDDLGERVFDQFSNHSLERYFAIETKTD